MSERVYRGWIPGRDGSRHAGRAALRDASWYRSPGRAGRYHIVGGDGGSECCGMPLILEDTGIAPRDMTVDPAAVEEFLRCRRYGCKERWP